MIKTPLYLASAAMIAALIFPVATHAQKNSYESFRQKADSGFMKHLKKDKHVAPHMRMGMPISGTVTAINGTTLTVSVPGSTTGTVYTVDASSSTMKYAASNTPIPLSAILVGDTVRVRGSTSGTTITAKTISDPSMIGRNLFMGKVTSVTGTTITVDSKMKGSATTTTYTVNANNATIVDGNTTSTAAAIQVGDHVKVFGNLSGTDIIATWIRDLGSKFFHHGWFPGFKK